MAEMEVSPQEEMANPQRMKVFAVERPGLPEDCRVFSCSVWSAIVATRICAESADCLGSATGVSTGRVSVPSPGLSAQVRRANSCTSCKPAHMHTSNTRTGRNG